ncbi:hypothetical protein G7Z17_g6324 [Cylindrodendrum hubeiense]|uniref:Xylanolytic transcriptional activator regulatory domain-containing protein n=1 Tax=Cylindrodendrum hubeiense TaxID=595255 RepID=A0A9P5H4Y4_9HYPO|nr:hypothetical protein G7Z17_g6324 [Cylindrodendrum hubeiense]
MTTNERTPLLSGSKLVGKKVLFSPANRVLVAGFLISVALSFTQVPILYVFRLMECEEFYRHHAADQLGDRCNRSEIDAGTAAQVSILGMSTTFCGVLNLFYAGWQVRNWGPRTAIVLQTLFPALRVAIQVVGVAIGARDGIIIVQSSQLISLVGGMSGYLLVLNTTVGELVPASERTAMFGMLQGSVMLGTSIGYLLGGVVGDTWGIRRPFEIAAVLFTLSSVYSALFIPYIDPKTLTDTGSRKQQGWGKLFGAVKVLTPKALRLEDGRRVNHYGITFLALGVFMGVLATGYAPILIQMYSTAAFNFLPTENSYLMASNSLIRGIFLMVFFPRIISSGRKWFSDSNPKESIQVPAEAIVTNESMDLVAGTPVGQEPILVVIDVEDRSGQAFDLFFLRWSLVVDGVVTASTAFATREWHIYLAGILLPLASGSAPASKGVITEMCLSSERADALQAMTLVENVAMLSTLGLFGFIFSTFSNIGKAYLTFYCNAAIALAAVAILFLSQQRRYVSSAHSRQQSHAGKVRVGGRDLRYPMSTEKESELPDEHNDDNGPSPHREPTHHADDRNIPRDASDDEAAEAVHQRPHNDDNLIYGGEANHTASVTVVNQGKTRDIDEDDENGDADCRRTAVNQISNLSFGTDWRTAVHTALPPREVVDFLTTAFFDYAQANYFCIHPEIFSRKLTAFYDGTHEFEAHEWSSSRRSVEFISVLFMVLAMGSQFADVGVDNRWQAANQDEVMVEDLLSSHDLSRIKVPVPAHNLGWRFYEVSRKLLPDIICSSSMASVQVCTLQGIYLPSTTSRDAGYNLLGLALRMAINMGLHRSFVASSLHAHVRELRNRLWWTIYVAERLYSVEMGRPLSLSDSEIDAPFPAQMPEWNDCNRGPANLDGLIAMARICRLLGRIVEAVYNRASAEKGAIIRPKVFHQLKRELEQWKRELPNYVHLENFTTRSEAHLALTYEQAIILLTRSCLNYSAAICQSDNTLGPEAIGFLRQQAKQCVKSAVNCIDIISNLKSLSLLCASSFHDSLYCSSALHVLLLASRKLPGIIAAPMESIYRGVLVLLELARGSEAAASSLRGIIRAMASSPARTDRQHANATSSSRANISSKELGRSAWKSWIMAQPNLEPDIHIQPAANRTVEAELLDSRQDAENRDSTTRFFQFRMAGHGHSGRQEGRSPVGAPQRYNQHNEALSGEEDEANTSSHVSDITQFWIPEQAEFDIMGRDLGGVLQFEDLN